MRLNAELSNVEQVKEMLDVTQKGLTRQSLKNCKIVLSEDNYLKGAFRFNLLADRIAVVKKMDWYRKSAYLTDLDVNHVILYMESNYGLSNENWINKAIRIVAVENRFHPVQEKLNSLVWDGKERIRHVLHYFFGAEETEYSYEIMKVFLLGAITRVHKPGAKFEYMLCLVGGQGAGKSTFFRFLAMNDDWFTDDLKKIEDDNAYRKMQGHWVIEMSEMIATANAKSIEDIKSFLSRQVDVYKTPYDKHPEDRPRQCVFGGTSNALDMLPLDRTGNRRFLPIYLQSENAECHILDNEKESRAYIEQMWAEAMEIYRGGKYSLVLSKGVAEQLVEYQRVFMPEDANTGMLTTFLEEYKGQYVCTKLLWHEGLGRDTEPKQYELREMGNIMNNAIRGWKKSDKFHVFTRYGKQRAWERDIGTELPDKEMDNGFQQLSFVDEKEIPFP